MFHRGDRGKDSLSSFDEPGPPFTRSLLACYCYWMFSRACAGHGCVVGYLSVSERLSFPFVTSSIAWYRSNFREDRRAKSRGQLSSRRCVGSGRLTRIDEAGGFFNLLSTADRVALCERATSRALREPR